MPRVLRRDYNTGELIEVAEQLLTRAEEDYKNCYDSPSRTKNTIEKNFLRQIIRQLKAKEKTENNAGQSGLF